jgi:hypothetical protein
VKFVNLGDRPLKFDLGGVVYECAVAGSVEIPDRVAFCVALHGIKLTPASEVEPAAKPAPEPEPAPVVEYAPEPAPAAPEKKRK